MPDVNLGIGGGGHGWQTGHMLSALETVLERERPDWVVVFGDTNSTLAAALAAVKLHLPLAHIEAGLRSFNRQMPEEHNRVLTDHCADLLLCPTVSAVEQLRREGVTNGVHLVGDIMYDAVLQFGARARERSTILDQLDLTPQDYLLATVHRPVNTDNPNYLHNILLALRDLRMPVIFPVHPRTRRLTEPLAHELQLAQSMVRLIEPIGYLDMLALEQAARMIVTDSGGMQKEAYFWGVPCLTLREETEWIETVATGWNVLVGADRDKIVQAIQQQAWPAEPPAPLFGDGTAAQQSVEVLERHASGARQA